MTSIAAKALTDAAAAVEDRHAVYGPPTKNFHNIARFWNAYLTARYGLAAHITATDVAAMSGLIKVARLCETPDHLDSWVDIAGYAGCGAEVSQPVAPEPFRTLVTNRYLFRTT